MNILLTNDDGIYADGIHHLALALKEYKDHKIYIVAPDRERSATGHAITLHSPLRVDKIKYFDTEIDAWSVNGTPSDCVKIAIECLLPVKPDLVLSGINRGPNLGTDVIYSGTVSAAIEACIFETLAIAVSVTDYENPKYETAAEFCRFLIDNIENMDLPQNTLLNVNVPSLEKEDVAGVRITKLGMRRWKNSFDKRVDPRGKIYYWLAGEALDEPVDVDSDIHCINNNMITISPIQFDLTNYNAISKIKKLEGWVGGDGD